ncbi:hypothetical protein EDB81DRAFT_488082 [Dactylonectria macrodidyma]|uniref:Transmembrane protein n=1 Tax=Dactylonectria macrodidyma TaxID=307937 RepID=A0A9P9EXB7_9HYPO|nr:hypothetical protein EDB81DRAFT_488082 [Dactylonectria macrodidyma]
MPSSRSTILSLHKTFFPHYPVSALSGCVALFVPFFCLCLCVALALQVCSQSSHPFFASVLVWAQPGSVQSLPPFVAGCHADAHGIALAGGGVSQTRGSEARHTRQLEPSIVFARLDLELQSQLQLQSHTTSKNPRRQNPNPATPVRAGGFR